MSVAGLQAEMQLAAEGKPLTGVWKDNHDHERRRWLEGKSRNLSAMAEACLASIRPEEAAEWFAKLLEEEWPRNRDAQEAMGRNYGADTWVAELTALSILRHKLPGHRAIGLLERSLAFRAAWYSLTSVSSVVGLGAKNQEVYIGIGSLTTGGRTNPFHFENHPADEVIHRVLTNQRPPVLKHPKNLTRLLDALMRIGGDDWSGVGGSTRGSLLKLVESEGGDLGQVRFAVSLLGPMQTLAPLMARRYQDGTLAVSVEWNPSSNTSCTFLAASKTMSRPLRIRDQVAYLHPYGEHARVRGGTALGNQLLGRGQTWWGAGGESSVFFCANLTTEEASSRKDGRRFVLSYRLPPHTSIVWELRTSPDAPPRLAVGGQTVTPQPPPPPPPPGPKPGPPSGPQPPEPKPPEPKPGPQPDDRWEHRKIAIDNGEIIVRVRPPEAEIEYLRRHR